MVDNLSPTSDVGLHILGSTTPLRSLAPDHMSVQNASAAEWLSLLCRLGVAGFVDVELTDSWLRPGDLSQARIAELGQVITAAGLRARAVSVSRASVIDPDHAEENLRYTHRSIDAAAQLGVPMISVGFHQLLTEEQEGQLWFWAVPGASDDVNDADLRRLGIARLRELALHAAEVGVSLSLEMYEDTFLGTADGAVELLAEIGLPNVGLNPDIGNLLRLPRPVEHWEAMLRKTLPFANYWHVKNYFRAEDPRTGAVFTHPAPMELGIINYRWAVDFARSSGFTGDFCVEHYGGDSLSVYALNRRYLEGLLI